jgi:hypothetical protein
MYPVNAWEFKVSEPAIERQPTLRMTSWHLVAEITLWLSRGPAKKSQWVLAGIRFFFILANGCFVFETGGTSFDGNLALISRTQRAQSRGSQLSCGVARVDGCFELHPCLVKFEWLKETSNRVGNYRGHRASCACPW